MRRKYDAIGQYTEIVQKYLEEYPSLSNSALAKVIVEEEGLDADPGYFRHVIGDYLRDIIPENVRLEKREQKRRDFNRIKNKAYREFARVENAVEEYTKEMSKLMTENGEYLKQIHIPEIENKNLNAIGVLQLSDVHANELINLAHNKYDFNIMSKRLKKFIHIAKTMFKSHGITKILIAVTGDLLNSDRRLDELLNQACNRAKASLLTAHIIQHAILDLRQEFEIDIVSVLGNESRMGKDFPSHSNVASDNYDFTIMAIVKNTLEAASISGINFISIDQMEEVVEILGQKWLISHDYKANINRQKDSQTTIGRYALAGTKLSYLIGGHIHATRITDISARSSSLAGSNEYNENFLNLAGRAAQNLYIVTKDSRHAMAIDLQNVEGIEGYPIEEKLEAYNTKSSDKTVDKVTIFEVKI